MRLFAIINKSKVVEMYSANDNYLVKDFLELINPNLLVVEVTDVTGYANVNYIYRNNRFIKKESDGTLG